MRSYLFLFLGPLLMFTAAADEGKFELGEPLPDELGITLKRDQAAPGQTEPGYVNLRVVDNKFQLWFLDAEKKVAEPDYPMAILHYHGFVVKKSKNTVQLKPTDAEDGLFFTSPRIVPPPHDLSVRILLMDKAEEEADNPNATTAQQEAPDQRKEFFAVQRLNQIPAEMEAAEKESETESADD